MVNPDVHDIVQAVFRQAPEDHPARRMLAGVANDSVRASVADSPSLRPLELAAFAGRNLSELELEMVRDMTVCEIEEDIRELAACDRIDRRARRLVFASDQVYSNFYSEELANLAYDLPDGDGLDDFVIGIIPKLVGTDCQFDAEKLIPRVGALAGAQVLAATGPAILSDERILELLVTPPERWEHSEEDRQWHQRAHIRDALYMLLTHRPELARQVVEHADLVQYATRSPHWEPEFAENIQGFDLSTGKLTDDATRNTPGLLLSLVWNPKTPVEQAEKIADIAQDGLDNTPYTDEWKVTAAASERRVDVQKWHVESYAYTPDTGMVDRLIRRVKSGVLKSESFAKSINGVEQFHAQWWPKRTEEAIALLSNPQMSGRDWNRIRSRISAIGTFTAPVNTWTREQLVKASLWNPLKMDNTDPLAGAPDRSFATTNGPFWDSFATVALSKLSNLDGSIQEDAWGLLMDLLEDSSRSVTPSFDLIDTTLATLA